MPRGATAVAPFSQRTCIAYCVRFEVRHEPANEVHNRAFCDFDLDCDDGTRIVVPGCDVEFLYDAREFDEIEYDRTIDHATDELLIRPGDRVVVRDPSSGDLFRDPARLARPGRRPIEVGLLELDERE